VRFRPGWSWTVSSTWVISSLTAAVTLILSVVLGAVVPLATDDWNQAQTRDQAWVLAVLTACSVVAGVIAAFLRRKRRQVLTGHGTAYVLYGCSTLKWPHCSSLIWPHPGAGAAGLQHSDLAPLEFLRL
jgi:hypothetical protein